MVSDTFDSAKAAAVSLLFQPGERPTARAIKDLAQPSAGFTVSLDPQGGNPADNGAYRAASGLGGAAGAEPEWLELLASGLTFDLSGLSPGPCEGAPVHAHLFGIAAADLDPRWEAITLTPGPHLAGGDAMLPVVRCLAWLAATMAVLPGIRAVAWHSARCWSSPQHFRQVVLSWMEGGVFPGLGLAALTATADDALQSEGLSLFVGQELRIEPELTADRAAAAKIALRLMHLLIENGPMTQVEHISLPSEDRLRLEPSANGRFVSVWRD